MLWPTNWLAGWLAGWGLERMSHRDRDVMKNTKQETHDSVQLYHAQANMHYKSVYVLHVFIVRYAQ